MNTVVTSKEEILKISRELMQQGWTAITIRSVAAGCRVSVGSIYNYFGSKEALVEATVESVWCEIFHGAENVAAFQDIQACISWMYRRMEYGCKRYPGFFSLHALSFIQQEHSNGKQRMHQIWQHILDGLCTVLQKDPHIRTDAFDRQFTPEAFANVLFSLMLSAFLRQEYDFTAILEIIRRSLY